MIASELKEGTAYFQVVYPDEAATMPIVITYEFSGTTALDDSGKQIYLFRYLPAFTYPVDEERSAADAIPIMLTGEQLDMLTLDELIGELKEVAGRALSRAAP